MPKFMTKTLSSLFMLSSGLALADAQKPNIILFLVDDMGWQDTSVPFHTQRTMWNKQFQTPNMERLAKMGVKFTQAYACPVSTPSRVSLLTGANATRHKVTNWTKEIGQTTDSKDPVLDFERWNYSGLSTRKDEADAFYCTPLAEVLKKGGYDTLFVGKAHFGAFGTDAAEPLNLGFNRNVGGTAAGSPGSYLGQNNYTHSSGVYKVPNLEDYYGKDIFLSEALTLEAKKLMDESLAKKSPFFLYLAHYAVHIPFDADNRFYDKYKKQGFEEQEARFASIVEGMDKSLGDIIDYVEEKGIVDNTIILFMSDNGGYTVGVRNKTFGGVNKNAPLRGGKGSVFEGGIREPMLAYVPKMTKAGTVNNSPVMIEDFYPSIVELAQAQDVAQTVQAMDSQSFVPALKGKEINGKRPLFWHYPNAWGERTNECGDPRSAIRLGDWKLIHDYATGTNMLFNLAKDIGETKDLASKNKTMTTKLAKILSDKLRAEGSTMPIIKATGKPCPYPDGSIE